MEPKWPQNNSKIDEIVAYSLLKNELKNVNDLLDFFYFFEKAELQQCGPRVGESTIFTYLGYLKQFRKSLKKRHK